MSQKKRQNNPNRKKGEYRRKDRKIPKHASDVLDAGSANARRAGRVAGSMLKNGMAAFVVGAIREYGAHVMENLLK